MNMNKNSNRLADDSFSKPLRRFDVPTRPVYYTSGSSSNCPVDIIHRIHVRIYSTSIALSADELVSFNSDFLIPSSFDRFLSFEGNFELLSHGLIPVSLYDDKIIEYSNLLMSSPFRLKDSITEKYFFTNTTYLIEYSVYPIAGLSVFELLPHLKIFSRAFFFYGGIVPACRTFIMSNL